MPTKVAYSCGVGEFGTNLSTSTVEQLDRDLPTAASPGPAHALLLHVPGQVPRVEHLVVDVKAKVPVRHERIGQNHRTTKTVVVEVFHRVFGRRHLRQSERWRSERRRPQWTQWAQSRSTVVGHEQ